MVLSNAAEERLTLVSFTPVELWKGCRGRRGTVSSSVFLKAERFKFSNPAMLLVYY